jgi:hypothetical protein
MRTNRPLSIVSLCLVALLTCCTSKKKETVPPTQSEESTTLHRPDRVRGASPTGPVDAIDCIGSGGGSAAVADEPTAFAS